MNYLKRNEPEANITDGYGNWWQKCKHPQCDLHVVRPGDARCDATFCKLGREWLSDKEEPHGQ